MADETNHDGREPLTFEQAEGAAPLPSQLKLKEVSQQMRSLLWLVIHNELDGVIASDHFGEVPPWLNDPWATILRDWHVFHLHGMVDEFENDARRLIGTLKIRFTSGGYVEILGFVQFVLRHEMCPMGLHKRINAALEMSHSAYRIADELNVVPYGSQGEHKAVVQAFSDLAADEFNGARTHLRNASDQLTAGNFGESVKESIHAVESVARILDPTSNTLDPALKRLGASVRIHPSLISGFGKLYGYTSDEEGVRHALLTEPVSPVDEAEALYMFGSCAAFVSYLIHKARASGLLSSASIKK
jgi:hypothetical protein